MGEIFDEHGHTIGLQLDAAADNPLVTLTWPTRNHLLPLLAARTTDLA
jgi:hypothetical protein